MEAKGVSEMRRWTGKKDAFGQLLYACHRGARGILVTERDDGWVDASVLADYFFADYRRWSERQKEAIALARGRVLDVGCGAGRVCLYLQKKGLEVVGIDHSPMAVKVCRERGVKKVREAFIETFDARPGTFDTAVLFGNNFGMFGTAAKARRILARLSRMTSPGAVILAEARDPYDTTVKDHLDYQRRNRTLGRMSGQLKMRIRYRNFTTPWLHWLLVSRDEMKEIVRGTGWKVERFIDNKGAMYVAVLEKAHRQEARRKGSR